MLGNVDLFADKIKCDYEKVNEDSGITEVVKRYFELLEEGKKEGFIPIFVEVKDYFNEEFPEFEEYKRTRDEILENYKKVDCIQWFKERKQEYIENEYLDEEYEFSDDSAYLDYFKNFNKDKTLYLNSIFDIETGKIRENVGLFKVPTDKVYEIPGWFLFGGFNECPLPEEIIAISKYWYEKYDARIVAITDSEIEFYLEKFPKTQKEAEELAIEQFLVSEDLVFQIYDELEELSKELYKAKNWYFWWD